ncbi:MAG: hypothetical protein PUB00_04350 [Clostridiales bacterium]|nr:hypothetical protein [Clostridiales bacterium]
MLYLLSVIYILLSASGLVLFKLGSQKGMEIGISAGVFHFKIGIVSLLGMVCYIMSFVLYLILVSKFDLNKIYPITTGCIFVCVMLGSFLVLKENIGIVQIIGSAAILIGVVLLALKQ